MASVNQSDTQQRPRAKGWILEEDALIFIVLNKPGFRASGKCHKEKINIIVNGHRRAIKWVLFDNY